MTSYSLLLKLESEDFSVDVRNGVLYIAPGSALTLELRELITEYKAKLIALFASKIDSFGCCFVCKLNIITFDGLCEVDFDRRSDVKEGVQECLSQNKPAILRQTHVVSIKEPQAHEMNLF